jgi:hypothetical protein
MTLSPMVPQALEAPIMLLPTPQFFLKQSDEMICRSYLLMKSSDSLFCSGLRGGPFGFHASTTWLELKMWRKQCHTWNADNVMQKTIPSLNFIV